MKLLLIAPSSGRWRTTGRGRCFNGRTFRFSLLSLLAVAAETPADVEIRIVDEQVEDIPWADAVDLVGITCMTAAAPRAYAIAARFRQRWVPVVLGGLHPTLCPEDARPHADALVVGEAEGVWPRVVADARAGRLAGSYRNDRPPDLAQLRRLPRELLRAGAYATVQAVQATRGCPHGCDFCSVAAFSHRAQRRRPIADVVREVAALPGRFFVFVDDNLVADRDYADDLFRALRPLRKRWITQATLNLGDDPELLDLAAAAGCVGVFVGLETFQADNLAAVQKTCNRTEHYRTWIRRFHARGIGVEAGVVFGFPGDQPQAFERTLTALEALEVDAILVSIFTPLPGTPRHASMAERLLDRNWAHYDFHHVVFEPWQLSTEALQAGHDWITREFYRPWRIARRVWRHLKRPRAWSCLPYLLALNLAFFGRTVRWHLRGWNPADDLAEGRRRGGAWWTRARAFPAG